VADRRIPPLQHPRQRPHSLLRLTSLSGIFNQYVNPIGIAALGWKFYNVYFVVLILECLAIYFLYVETKGPALEEIALLLTARKRMLPGRIWRQIKMGGLKEVKRGEN
jgi:hypothetical protein